MFRYLLLIIVVFSLFVFMRLVLLRLKILEIKQSPPEQPLAPTPRTIDAPQPLEVKSYMFTNFDYRVGPKNSEEFYEKLVVNVGEADANANSTRTYSLYVSTPTALASEMRVTKQDYKFGRNLLVIERYDMNLILRAVRDHINELGLLGEDIG